MTISKSSTGIRLRVPCVEDGAAIWELVKNTRVLDINSPYSYLMFARYFQDTCVAAEDAGKIVGFVSAFRSPAAAEVIFVWQVAVEEAYRRRGLGMAMLTHLLNSQACRGIRFLEITVTPSNQAASSLYRRLAKELGVRCEIYPCFPGWLFPGGKHEDEMMFRIGPLKEMSRKD
ncbi:MAG: diaminobutyrate acetyltransferase [Syntrophothermaceae bacterium]|jgi:L-2,4-diaminobutyric acid acetyltransferase